MQDLPVAILQLLDKAEGELTSIQLSEKTNAHVQKVVGAIKSLEALGDVVSTEIYQVKRWEVTKEGLEVIAEGSHEYRVYAAVGVEGVEQSKLLASTGAWGKIGFSKAMSLGWIAIDKAKGRVVRKAEGVADTVQAHLNLIQSGAGDSIEAKVKTEYKKRKLVEEVTEKHYKLRKGSNFSTKIEKAPTELTAEMMSSGSWRSTKLKPYNLDALGMDPGAGCLHPLLKVRAEYRQIFLEMGFSEMPANNFVESSFWNFDALFQPQQHPARDAHDTFFISDPQTSDRFPEEYKERVQRVHSQGGFGSQGYGYDWKIEEASKNLLRTHTTAVSARMLYRTAQQTKFVPQKLFSIDRVFRNETLDATHLAEFHQIEGVVADYGLTLGDCIGVINTFFTKLGIEKLRFKPAYNPYTEPSMEIFSYHEGLGKWVEIGNSGMFRPEMLLPMGLPEGVNVIGFGLSLERPTMIKYKIDNIRDLVGHRVDLDMVKRNPICRIDKAGGPSERQIQALSRRYDRIDSRLEFIQQKLAALGGSVPRAAAKSSSPAAADGSSKQLVIRAHPDRPPYGVSKLLSLVQKHFKLYTCTHTHSSVKKPGPLLLQEEGVSRGEAEVCLNLIYTDVDATTLIVGSTTIKGEGNVLRYLARLIDQRYDSGLYETRSAPEVSSIDSVLDRLADTSKHNVTTTVSALLSKQSYLASSKPTLADLLAYSLCEQNKVGSPAIKTWAANINKHLATL